MKKSVEGESGRKRKNTFRKYISSGDVKRLIMAPGQTESSLSTSEITRQ